MKKLLLVAGLALGALPLNGIALAQDAAIADDAAQAPAAEPIKKPRQLDEIVVTAQKREQNVKEVPISVSTISGDDLREGNIENMNDLSKVTPNLKISADGVYNFISIRGLGSGLNAGFDQSVGLFIDDIYYSSPQRLIAALFDLERIEVLRGPQGTLFGRNTIAGAVSMHTGTVDHEFELFADTTMGQLNWNKHTVILNAPIFHDKLATRLGVQYFKRDGHIYDRLMETPNGTITAKSGRAKFRYTVSDDLDLQFIAQYQKTDGKGQGDQYHHVPDEYMPYFQAFDPQVEDNLDDYAHSTNYYSGGVAEYNDYMGKAEFRALGHDGVLIVGYATSESDGGVDVDFGPSPTGLAVGGGYSDDINAEFRILSDPGTFEYVTGLYYYYNDKYSWSDIMVLPIIGTGTVNEFIIPPVAQAIAAGIIPETTPLYEENRQSKFGQISTSYAAYGQLTWNVTDWLSLIAGARVSYDKKEVDFTAQTRTVTGEPIGPAVVYPLLLGAEDFEFQGTREDRSFTPKLSAIYRVTDEINIYATWAQGAKAGGFNAAANNLQGEMQFDGEFSNTYEMGVKGDYFGGAARFNVGLFRTEFDDLQVSIFNGLDFIVDNAAQAISQGVEMDGMVILPAGFLLTTTASWLDAYYASFPMGSCKTESYLKQDRESGDFCDRTGVSLAGTPEFQFTFGVNYLNSLGNLPFDLVVGLDIYWQDEVYFGDDHDPADYQEAYHLLNGRVGVRDDDGAWTFMVFVRNITDETVLISSFDVPIFAGAHVGGVEPPRTVTANFNISF
ncbi:MAG: TonB-dependent receptor [Alphaproteobacteria bacterium]